MSHREADSKRCSQKSIFLSVEIVILVARLINDSRTFSFTDNNFKCNIYSMVDMYGNFKKGNFHGVQEV